MSSLVIIHAPLRLHVEDWRYPDEATRPALVYRGDLADPLVGANAVDACTVVTRYVYQMYYIV